MISIQKIHELAIREQTSDINIAREYLQHLFLNYFYKKEGSDVFLFKGGTALRIIFGSPRYSEDLDFSIPALNKKVIEDHLLSTFESLQKEGIITNMHITDAEPTSGGYIANIDLDILGFQTGIKSNLQVKSNRKDLEQELQLIENALFLPTYSVISLLPKIIVREKIQALLTRHKPRDFFDLYFMNRKEDLREFIPRDLETRKGILESLDKIEDQQLANDLKPFLPVNYHAILKTLRKSLMEQFRV